MDCHDLNMFLDIDEEEDKEFICPIGSGVLKDAASLGECGHTFCKPCITKWLKNNSTCPIDRKPVSIDRLVPNFPICNMVNKQKVACCKAMNVEGSRNSNVDYAARPGWDTDTENKCVWKGQLQQLLPHRQKDCPFEKIGCPNEGCPLVDLERRHAAEHQEACQFKLITCEFCGNNSIKLMDKQAHLDVCPQKLIPCPQACSKMVRPIDLQKHIQSECPLTVLDCPCKDFGCKATMKREELEQHLKREIDSHIVYFSNGLQQQSEMITELKTNLDLETKKREELSVLLEGLQSRVKALETNGPVARSPSQLFTQQSNQTSNQQSQQSLSVSSSVSNGQAGDRNSIGRRTSFNNQPQAQQPQQQQQLNQTSNQQLQPSSASATSAAQSMSQPMSVSPIQQSGPTKLYVIGGHDGAAATNRFEAYDPTTRVWVQMPSLREKRCCHASVAFEGKIYVLGGSGTNQLNSVEIFDPVTGSWSQGPSMLSKRNCTAASVLNGKLYVVGGHDGVSRLSSVEFYNPATKTWAAAASMSAKRSSPAVAVLDGKLYAIGGGDGSTQLNTVECYDPTVDRWTLISSMTTKRLSPAAAVLGGYLYVLGGFDSSHYFNTVERYDPRTGTWSLVAPMNSKRGSAAAAVLGDKIYVVGGYDNQTSRLNTVEYFDPITNTWGFTTPMSSKCGNIALVSF